MLILGMRFEVIFDVKISTDNWFTLENFGLKSDQRISAKTVVLDYFGIKLY